MLDARERQSSAGTTHPIAPIRTPAYLIDGIDDGSDESRFLQFCRDYIGKGSNATEYQSVDQIAVLFGTDFRKLKKYLIFKEVIRRSLRRPSERTV